MAFRDQPAHRTGNQRGHLADSLRIDSQTGKRILAGLLPGLAPGEQFGSRARIQTFQLLMVAGERGPQILDRARIIRRQAVI